MPEEEREEITVKDLAMSNAYQLEALINVLQKKGLLTSDEVLEELASVVANQKKRVN
jgi:hypothetical protein